MRMTRHTRRVLQHLRTHDADEEMRTPTAMMAALDIGPATMFRILFKLGPKGEGWLEQRKEDGDAAALGRPLHQHYRLTDAGWDGGRREGVFAPIPTVSTPSRLPAIGVAGGTT